MKEEGVYSLVDAFRAIEQQLAEYGEKRLKDLIRGRDVSDGDLHFLRGKVQATEEISKLLRNALGYDPSTI